MAKKPMAESEDDIPTCVNPLRLLNVVRATSFDPYGGLWYVDVPVNWYPIKALIDTRTFHNVVSAEMAQKFDLPLNNYANRMKVVNSEARVAKGSVCGADMQVGNWEGKCDLLSVALDVFELILGNEFIRKAKVRKKVAKGEPTFLVALVEITPDNYVELPDKVVGVFVEFKDVMPPELPKCLPPRHAFDHTIDLEPCEKAPASVPYRMSPGELAELRTELLNDLLKEGYKIAKGQDRIDECKVKAIHDWLLHQNVPTLRSFLGLANYYRKFIVGYAKKVATLTDLLKKEQGWDWTDECDAAFRDINQAIVSEPALKFPVFYRHFKVNVDASDRAIGGVLIQDGHPVAFESRKLEGVEQRYTTHEKEMVAVMHCLRVWREYLLGPKFIVKTYNLANTCFKMQLKLSLKQAQWQEFLGEYDFEWEHKPSWHNAIPNALSRRYHELVTTLTTVEEDFTEKVRASILGDKSYEKMKEKIESGITRRFLGGEWFSLCQGQ
ncbi:hypothetical protein BVRB_3g059490 [Beta vulgaris subsp. vulgaris]|nr:hypothetical protein BVRB_3g059490 [Beta vulgaris subsp. vulgaris]